jgi:hypothetical protein
MGGHGSRAVVVRCGARRRVEVGATDILSGVVGPGREGLLGGDRMIFRLNMSCKWSHINIAELYSIAMSSLSLDHV